MTFNDASLTDRVAALEQFARIHESRHAGLRREIQALAKKAKEAFTVALTPTPFSALPTGAPEGVAALILFGGAAWLGYRLARAAS